MMHTMSEFSLPGETVQSNNVHDDDDQYQHRLTKNLKHVSLSRPSYSDSEENMFLPIHYSEDDEILNLDEMRKIFKQQHPWSVSDPFPQPFIPEFFAREYNSTPNLKSGVERKHRHLESFNIVQENIVSSIVGNKPLFKWVIVVLNVVIELCQATIVQESSQGKLKREIYLKLSIIASLICLIMSIVEIFHEGKSKGVIWVQKSYICCWFYNLEGELFGSFALYFGLISSIVQLIANVAQKVTKRSPVKFDYLPLLFSVCYLVAAIIGCREKSSRGVVRCKIHGYNVVEGVLVEGHDSLVFECPQCDFELS